MPPELEHAAGAVEAARWIVWEASQLLGCPSASIHELYMARGRGEISGFTVPAINLFSALASAPPSTPAKPAPVPSAFRPVPAPSARQDR